MEKYIPDVYQQSIFTIDYQKLLDKGIKCILIDLDNTLVPCHIKEINEKISELFDKLKVMGFNIIIFSNNTKNRLKPFKESLKVDCCAKARKPNQKKFLNILKEYKYTENEVAIIGDQMLTDIVGGNKVGITTILINPISTKDYVWTKPNRFLEKIIMKKLRDNNLFSKGRYYE